MRKVSEIDKFIQLLLLFKKKLNKNRRRNFSHTSNAFGGGVGVGS